MLRGTWRKSWPNRSRLSRLSTERGVRCVTQPYFANPMGRSCQAQPDDFWEFLPRWLPTTPLVKHSTLTSQPIARGLVSIAWNLVREETDYRATVIIMALNAWKAEHGKLPDRLDELVGSQLDRLPLDPLFAQPFQYFPRGTPEHGELRTNLEPGPPAETSRVVYGDPAGRRQLTGREPVIWSALSPREGQQIVGLLSPESGRAQADFPYRMTDRREVSPSPVGPVLYGGTAYPISQLAKEKR